MRSSRAVHRAIVIGAAWFATARAAAAEDDVLSYRVRPGDTLNLVAAEFYGDHQRTTVWLMAANKLQRQRKLVPGEKIRVPVGRDITTAKGDTFASLARVYLGDEARAASLAEFNHMAPTQHLATGTALVIPLRAVHTAAGKESLAQICQWFYGDPKHAEMLRAYNRLETTQLDKNDTVIVPSIRVRVRPDKLPATDAAGIARRARRTQASADALAAVPQARAAWRQADFAGVKEALAQLATAMDFLEANTAAEVGILLGKAHIAFDETPAAVALFREVLTRQPTELSPYLESPKIIAAWKQAGGRVRSDRGVDP